MCHLVLESFNLLQRLWHGAVWWYNFCSPQLLLNKGSQCLLQPRLGAAGCAPIRVMGSSQIQSLVQLLFSVPYTTVKWKTKSRFMLSAVTRMILTTQTNVCQKSTGCLQSAQSAADRSTLIRLLISQATLLACIAQHTGLWWLSWMPTWSGLMLCNYRWVWSSQTSCCP